MNQVKLVEDSLLKNLKWYGLPRQKIYLAHSWKYFFLNIAKTRKLNAEQGN